MASTGKTWMVGDYPTGSSFVPAAEAVLVMARRVMSEVASCSRPVQNPAPGYMQAAPCL